MISCHACGHECTEKDLEIRINLCDHLYLEELADQLENKEKAPWQFSWREGMPCPRCQGLMRAETFIDWSDNCVFRGWRCICCGNIWDQVIAANRAYTGEVFAANRGRKPVYP